MLWLSNDSNTSCSHHHPGSVAVSPPPPSSHISFCLPSNSLSWRSRLRLLGLNLLTTVAVTFIFCSVFVMVVRCEPSSSAARSNGSDWKTFVRHSLQSDHFNQTSSGISGGAHGGGSGRWHRSLRSSPTVSRAESGHARHRHKSHQSWFDPSPVVASDEDRHHQSLSAARRMSENAHDEGKGLVPENVLPAKRVSKSGAMSNLPRNSDAALKSQPDVGMLTPEVDDGVPRVTSANGSRAFTTEVETGRNFTPTRRLHRKKSVGSPEADKSVEPSQTLCLIPGSEVNSSVCSPQQSRVLAESSNATTGRKARILNYFHFCNHLQVAGAVNTSSETCRFDDDDDDDDVDDDDDATEEENLECLDDLFQRDSEAQFAYEMFEDILSKFDCEDPYSTKWNCTHCKLAYRHWVCSVKIPHYRGTELIQPCSHYSDMVENRCPYLSPHSQSQYAGEAVFLGQQSHATSKELQLRSCHFLCQDRSINPQTEEDSCRPD